MSEAKKEVVTEEDLLKSLEKLEGKQDKPDEKKEQVVKTPELKKSAQDEVNGSGGLRKTLEVSAFLKSFSETIGLHVDQSLGTLQKSIADGAQRDLAIVRVLESLQKSIDGLKTEMAKFGDKPASTPKTISAGNGSSILEKSGVKEEKISTPDDTKKMVLAGLEKLAKAEKPGSPAYNRITSTVVKFESTGQISDVDLRNAMSSYKS